MRPRWARATLLVLWMTAVGAACQAQAPPPEVAVARLPPDLMAAKRKTVGDALLTGVLAYQNWRPIVQGACGGDAECHRNLERADSELQNIFTTFWEQLFVWPATPAGYVERDYGKMFDDLLKLILKLAKYVPLARALPSIPGVPQFAPTVPKAPAQHLQPASAVESEVIVMPAEQVEDLLRELRSRLAVDCRAFTCEPRPSR